MAKELKNISEPIPYNNLVDLNKCYKLYLNDKAKEVEDSSKANAHLKEKHNSLLKQNQNLQSQIEQQTNSLKILENELTEKINYLLRLQRSVYQLGSLQNNEEEHSENFPQSNSPKIQNNQEKIIKLIDYFKELEIQKFALQKEHEILSSKIIESEHRAIEEIKCINCHQNFTLANNHNGACAYHPGRLNFFSCRGCGKDAYMTCCNKCTECLKGCKIGRHIGSSL
ncbi:unnamed protein product [Blepharisma stoltei]|uniref:C2H2-type domain-containing protein n=1 Tax=Blepharisma stoltei TaxID=1481888 RepID=A0AAU9K6A5_9CILI|nr:unnamed protein product [Blepharisma stoltei]